MGPGGHYVKRKLFSFLGGFATGFGSADLGLFLGLVAAQFHFDRGLFSASAHLRKPLVALEI